MKNKVLTGLFGLILLVAIVSFSANASAAQIIVKTIPEKNVWVADGVTEYRMDVWADNTELNGEWTEGAQWRILKPVGLENYITITDAEIPTQSIDFFAGYNMFYQSVTPSWSLQGRLTSSGGPANRTGYLGSYWFTVSPGFVGQTSFNLDNVGFLGPGGTSQQPYIIQNVPFTVVKMGLNKQVGSKVTAQSVNKCSWPNC